MAPILGIWASSRPAAAVDTGAMFPLQVITVGPAGASSVSFTNIPGTYTHLQIRAIARATSGTVTDNWYIQFNGDTAANYSKHDLYGNGAVVGASASTSISAPNIGLLPSTANVANSFGASVLDILDYKDTNKFKTMRCLSGFDNNGSDGYVFLYSGNWRSTSAITSMTLTPVSGSGNFAANSQFALYGVKGAA